MALVVILTALPVEYLAVRHHLTNLKEVMNTPGTIYERGQFITDNQTWDVGIAEIGAGNTIAATETERAIVYFNPDYLIFVGIAGGIKDVDIGSVVAATKVYGYESGKVDETFSTRPAVGQSTYAILQRAKSETRKGEWVKRIPDSDNARPQAFLGPIAAGEKVIASRESKLFQFLRDSYNDAIAVEMEGFGFLQAAFAYPKIQTLVIRGISDLIKDKNAEDSIMGNEEDRQKRASQNASAFAFEILAKFQVEEEVSDGSVEKEEGFTFKELEELLKARSWEKANQYTDLLMSDISIASINKRLGSDDASIYGLDGGVQGAFDFMAEKKLILFPPSALLEINRLWIAYSRGRFGFSVQKRICMECAGKNDGNLPSDKLWNKLLWNKFNNKVGWRVGSWLRGRQLRYDELDFSELAPSGHLPVRICSNGGLAFMFSNYDL
ncbi:phosphorylase family protein [Leptothoe spongobia]|uniref:GUN4 domain-containing protein n=1 Tax=Leptothoe spongobia TAU-MAC 1115 TaxID=1967444 RepID=A0A947DGE0_9CYAN|nr:GUN4 domain-containing protein [Leptothoe spongobia]MBT9316445.1 GUN4 domain-containing protein [Leptothoe spongobia TAU-MAC 1115]